MENTSSKEYSTMNEIEYIINCSECNETTTVYAETLPEYCPMCGRRVEAESKMNEEDTFIFDE